MPGSLRTALAACLACTCALASAGCGSSKAPSGPGGSSAEAIAAGTEPVSLAQAKAFAEAVNLKASDMPGATQIKPDEEKQPGNPGESSLSRCAGMKTVPAPEFRSPTFEQKFPGIVEQVSSNTEVLASAAAASSDLSLARTARARRCLRKVLAGELGGPTNGKPRYTGLKITTLPGPAAVKNSFVIRVGARVSSAATRGRAVPFVLQVDGFASGRAIIGLMTLGIPEAVPGETVEMLLRKLAARAGAPAAS